MPQIANQDYNIVKTVGSVSTDAAVLAALMKAFQQGTIFDVIVDDNSALRRVVFAAEDVFGVGYSDSIEEIPVEHTLPQYEGLAAIQQAALAQGEVVDRIPSLICGAVEGHYELGVQVIADLSDPIVDEDGHVYSVTFDDDFIITAVQKTQQIPEFGWEKDPITVPFEEVQKLIGITILEA